MWDSLADSLFIVDIQPALEQAQEGRIPDQHDDEPASIRHLREIQQELARWQPTLPETEVAVPFEVAWCEGDLLADYLHDMGVMQRYAMLNLLNNSV